MLILRIRWSKKIYDVTNHDMFAGTGLLVSKNDDCYNATPNTTCSFLCSLVYPCMHVCMDECMYVCMYACTSQHVAFTNHTDINRGKVAGGGWNPTKMILLSQSLETRLENFTLNFQPPNPGETPIFVRSGFTVASVAACFRKCFSGTHLQPC